MCSAIGKLENQKGFQTIWLGLALSFIIRGGCVYASSFLTIPPSGSSETLMLFLLRASQHHASPFRGTGAPSPLGVPLHVDDGALRIAARLTSRVASR